MIAMTVSPSFPGHGGRVGSLLRWRSVAVSPSFPGHGGRVGSLLRWRSVARSLVGGAA
jgi:hypothetical protein